MSWLSKATGIHIGGSVGKFFKRTGNFINKVFPGSPGFWFGKKAGAQQIGAMAGLHTETVSAANKERDEAEKNAAAAAAKAAHDAEVARLAEEALGGVNFRRRRGQAATRLTGSSGARAPVSTGKTLLSQ